ncbi:MAG TPA: ECF-type sigma factor [Thermoanaerobaculia bacterium]|nr:ECF-type sigma factor [Thermoanaerobaculia bacterium]
MQHQNFLREEREILVSSPDSGEITALLQEWGSGKPGAFDKLITLVRQELQQAAAYYFQREKPGHILQPTALVSEVCLRLMGWPKVRWDNRAQFFSFAAQLMRYILVEQARASNAAMRGSGIVREPLTAAANVSSPETIAPEIILTVHEALSRISQDDSNTVEIVELRFFAGMTLEEIAEALRINISTVKRRWKVAKQRLALELEDLSPDRVNEKDSDNRGKVD